jgi:hypothetical protein
MTLAELFTKTAEGLRRYGWQQGSYGDLCHINDNSGSKSR